MDKPCLGILHGLYMLIFGLAVRTYSHYWNILIAMMTQADNHIYDFILVFIADMVYGFVTVMSKTCKTKALFLLMQ